MNPSQETREPSHYCGLVVIRFSPEIAGELEGLVTNYQKLGSRTQIKWAGGTSKNGEEPFADMVKTVRREAKEEIGDEKLPPKFHIKIELSDEALKGRLLGKPTVLSPTHAQYFYFVAYDEMAGTLRQRDVWDGDEKLSPPYWLETEKLAERIFHSHRPALFEALEFLCRNSEETRKRYLHLLKKEGTKIRG